MIEKIGIVPYEEHDNNYYLTAHGGITIIDKINELVDQVNAQHKLLQSIVEQLERLNTVQTPEPRVVHLTEDQRRELFNDHNKSLFKGAQ